MNKEFEETTIRRKAIVITSVLTVVTVLIFGVLVIQVLTDTTSGLPMTSFIGLVMMGLLVLSSGVGAWYCRNGRSHLGVGLAGAGLLAVASAIPFIAVGRASYTSPLTVAMVIVTAPQLFSSRIANRIVMLSVFMGIATIMLDIWLPVARTASNTQPYAIYVFGAGVVIYMVYAAFQYRNFKLQTKLLAFFVLIPLIIVMVVGGALILRIFNQQQAQVESDVQALVQNQSKDVLNFISGADADIQFLSQNVSLENYLSLLQDDASDEAVEAARATLMTEFFTFAQARLIYDQIRFIDATGQEIVRVDTNRSGVTTLIADAELQNKADRPYFVDTARLDLGEIFVSALDLNVERGEIERPFKPVLRYGTPVFHNGQFQGIVITNIMAEFMLEPLATDSRNFYLVDQDGYFLFHPDPSKQWGRDLGTNIAVGQEFPEAEVSLLSTALAPTILPTDTDLLAYQPIILNNESSPRWFLMLATPVEEILAPINEVLAPMQYVLAIALMLTPLVSLFVSQSIAAPIIRLSEIAKKIGQGNFETVIQVESGDEVGVLANTFQSMTTQLSSLINSLESRVAARTRDLTLAVDVSHQVAHVQTLETLLANAVTLVRDRFDLYYTQIYLVEGRSLSLKAGTGNVGKVLLQKGHKLAIGPGSINGAAVSGKQSIIVADTAASPIFRPNPLLPDTRSEMAVPLIVRDKVVGVLNLQSAEPNALTEENLFAFEALAGQLASAIENARLFAEVAEGQAVIEAQMKRLMRQGWESYLDGVHNSEYMGYVYENGKVTAVSEPSPGAAHQRKWDIQLLDERLGQVMIDQDPEKPLTPTESELVNVVSYQVGQQIENLRLLADARRYQEEAEAVAHRLIRDGWSSYQEETAVTGYIYNQQEVLQLLPDSAADTQTALIHPLTISGERIGEISLSGVEGLDEQTQEIVAAVTDQLSTHLENLRLAQQSEMARAEAERRSEELDIINRIVTRVAASLDLQHSLQTIVDELVPAIGVDQARVALVNEHKTEMIVVAEHYDPLRSPSAIGTSIPVAGNPLTEQIFRNQETVFIEDALNDKRTAPVHDIFSQQGIHSIIIIPIIIGDEVIGTVGLDILEKRPFNTEKLQFAETIVYQAATAVQNARLFEQTQAALAETEMLYSYSSQLNTATNLDAILDSAAAPGLQVGATDAYLFVYNQSAHDDPGEGQIVATVPKENLLKTANLYLPGQPFGRLWPSGGENILFVGNVEQDGRLSPEDQAILKQHAVEALAILFLTIGNLRLGQIVIRWDKHQTFTSADERLYGAIAQQASSVVYNRLLFNQTEEALSETAALYQASADLNSAQSYEQVLTALRQHTILGQGSSIVALNFFDRVWEADNLPEEFNVLARWSALPLELPNQYKLAFFPELTAVLKPDEMLVAPDLATDERIGETTRAIFMNMFKAKSLIYVPIVVGQQWIGFINGIYSQAKQFPEAELRRLNVLVRQAAISVQSIRLLQETHRRAEREALINSINQKIQAAPTVQFALQTAVTELSQALKLKKAVIELASNSNGHTDA